MESSHLVIFSTSGKFITKFNVLRCIGFELNTILDRGQGLNTSHLNTFGLGFLANLKRLGEAFCTAPPNLATSS